MAREAPLVKGLYISGKENSAKRFQEVFSGLAPKDVVLEASNLGKNWASSRNDEEKLKSMVAHALAFFWAFCNYLEAHPL